jgi:uncharacterized protein
VPGGTPPPPPTNASVQQLLADAQTQFNLANQALQKAPPDFTAYGQHIKQAESDIAQAQAKLAAPGTAPAPTSTTVPNSTTTRP